MCSLDYVHPGLFSERFKTKISNYKNFHHIKFLVSVLGLGLGWFLQIFNNSGALCVHVAQVTCAGVRISSGLSCCVNRPL